MPRNRLVAGNKMRQIRSRIEKIAMSLPAKAAPTPQQAIIQMALRLTPGEDLIVLRRIIKAGRPLLTSTQQESRAIAAYQSAVEKATRLMNETLKGGKIHRRNR
jgi:hypothetical protein